MNDDAARRWHGIGLPYHRAHDGARADRLRALAELPLRLDRAGVETAWGIVRDPMQTVISGVKKLGTADGLALRIGETAFEEQVERIARTADAPALALGGGVDATAVLRAWRKSSRPMPAVLTLETGLADYDEVEQARSIARAVGLRCNVVRIDAEGLLDLLPEAIVATETPLYNLHPVTRFALAREAQRRGYDTLVTGDGADALFRNEPDLDYVPIVHAMTIGAGMSLASPFLDGVSPVREKRALYDYVRTPIAPKRARFMPALDMQRYATDLEPLAEELQMEIHWTSARARIGWATLGLLVRSLRGA